MSNQMRPHQKLAQLPTSLHLIVSFPKFRYNLFKSSSLALKYSASLLSSQSSGEVLSCPVHNNLDAEPKHRCLFSNVAQTKAGSLNTVLTHRNVHSLIIFSARQSTDWTIEIVKNFAHTIEDLSVVMSSEPTGLAELSQHTMLCPRLTKFTIEILSSRRFGNLQDRLPRQFANNLQEFGVTFPVITIDLLRWLNNLPATINTIRVNSVTLTDYNLFQEILNDETKIKLTAIPSLRPQVDQVLGLSQFGRLGQVSIDCSNYDRTNLIVSLLSQLSSLSNLESINFEEVKAHTFTITYPLLLQPLASLQRICIRFASGLISPPTDFINSHVWPVLLTNASELKLQNYPLGGPRQTYLMKKKALDEARRMHIDTFPNVKVIVE